ncbi:MAG: hypothetical protein WCJ25_05460 [Candidatus Moraniibacteriota bacterium]
MQNHQKIAIRLSKKSFLQVNDIIHKEMYPSRVIARAHILQWLITTSEA